MPFQGVCVVNASTEDVLCDCAVGYAGPRCERLLSVAVDGSAGSHLVGETWSLGATAGNLTLTLVTKHNTGVLAFFQQPNAFIALELFDGRVKMACNVGNEPASHAYSYVRGRRVDEPFPKIGSSSGGLFLYLVNVKKVIMMNF